MEVRPAPNCLSLIRLHNLIWVVLSRPTMGIWEGFFACFVSWDKLRAIDSSVFILSA